MYLHCWQDEEYEKVEEVYPKYKYLYIQKPFKFTKYREGIESPNDDKSRPLKDYDVWGNFRTFPMFYSWEETYNALRVTRHKYDCVIRSRYDLGADVDIDLNKLDLNKIEAFIIPPGIGVNYNPGTWHFPLISTEDMNFLVVDRKGSGDNLVIENLDKENITLKY